MVSPQRAPSDEGSLWSGPGFSQASVAPNHGNLSPIGRRKPNPVISADLLCPIDQPHSHNNKSKHGPPQMSIGTRRARTASAAGSWSGGRTRDGKDGDVGNGDDLGTANRPQSRLQNHRPEKGDDARTVFWTRSDVISLTKDAREKLGYETRLGR